VDVDTDDDLPGRASRIGQNCDCGARVVGSDVCAWCGGTYPPLSEATARAVERVRERVIDDLQGIADL